MLEVRDLNTFYDQYQALYDISLTVGDGEFVIVVGPNGHGKSTLLKSICGLVSPKSGTIKLDGEHINGKSCPQIVNKGLVYVAENRHLFPEMTVRENLLLGAYNQRARKLRAKNLEYVFTVFPLLEQLSDRAAGALSGGEARMVAIGRGLMSDAHFIALDEPQLGWRLSLSARYSPKSVRSMPLAGASSSWSRTSPK